jgi:hypothetical protein
VAQSDFAANVRVCVCVSVSFFNARVTRPYRARALRVRIEL